MPKKLTVMFTCHGCGLQGVRVAVKLRQDDEKIEAWMAHVGEMVGRKHRELAPTCQAGAVDIAVPTGGTQGSDAKLTFDECPEFMRSRAAN